MALRKIFWQTDQAAPAPRPRPSANLDGAIAAPSPARALQEQLQQRTGATLDVVKWSARRRLAFLVTSASGLWLAVIASGYGVAHMVG